MTSPGQGEWMNKAGGDGEDGARRGGEAEHALRAVTTGDGESRQNEEKETETRRGSLHHAQRADDLRRSARDCAPTVVILVRAEGRRSGSKEWRRPGGRVHLQGLLVVDRTPRPDPGRGVFYSNVCCVWSSGSSGHVLPLEPGHIWEGSTCRVVGLNPSRGLGPAGTVGLVTSLGPRTR